jgi:DNA-binding NarL/FixJ family response regulator
MSPGWGMAGIETAVQAARRYIIKRPRLTRLLDRANARVLMLIAPAGFGKTTLAREWAGDRAHVWYQGTTATADVAALAAGLSEVVSELIPDAGSRMIHRMRATGTPEEDVDVLAELLAEDLAEWPDDAWLVFDDYQFAMEAKAPERFIEVLVRDAPVRLLLTSRKRPSWASARRLLYGEVYELGRTELAMDHDEAASVLAHKKDSPAAGLVALAEGWPAVIGLAALTDDFELPEGSLPDALYEYFAEELYQAASPEVQRGLCLLALAPSLVECIADPMLGHDAPTVIAEGVRLGFLTSRAGGLEVHPLLRAFLDPKVPRAASGETQIERLSAHLASLKLWDDAFALLERFYSEHIFVSLFERSLTDLLEESRLPTLARWVELADEKHVDAPIVDLARAEVAFSTGLRRKAEDLALRAARRLDGPHPLRSQAYYVAGSSARMDYRSDRAESAFESALAYATTTSERRDAVWGQLLVRLDVEPSGVDALQQALDELDDGSALSEVRLAIARLLVAIRRGDPLYGVEELYASLDDSLGRVTDPRVVSSFLTSRALLLAVLGRYEEAHSAATRLERYARDVRLPFVVPYARRIRAMAELGLRHFSRCLQTIEWLDRKRAKLDDIFLELETRMLRCRLLISQGLAERGVEALRDPPERFPFEGERGEYLATLALAHACSRDPKEALTLVNEAEAISETVEVQTLVPLVRAIVELLDRNTRGSALVADAGARALKLGNIDSLVLAYRACPELLNAVANDSSQKKPLLKIMLNARDRALAKKCGLVTGSSQPANDRLTPREAEVIGLIAQGLTNKQIADVLFISESTVKVHVLHIFEKLGVRTRTEAALRVAAMSTD